jgi:hypothetical protein
MVGVVRGKREGVAARSTERPELSVRLPVAVSSGETCVVEESSRAAGDDVAGDDVTGDDAAGVEPSSTNNSVAAAVAKLFVLADEESGTALNEFGRASSR